MALHQRTIAQWATSHQDFVRVLLIVAAVIVLMLVATAVFGVQQAGPSYEIVPDPVGGLGLPF